MNAHDIDAATDTDTFIAATDAEIKRTRNTRQRKAVLEALRGLDGHHPTAADVFERVRTDYPQMSLATVYRALHALVDQKYVSEMRVENVVRYDAGLSPHHHVICRRCGTVRDVCSDCLSVSVLAALEECTGFVLDTHPMQLSGLCAACRA